jgi:hypothetical protein
MSDKEIPENVIEELKEVPHWIKEPEGANEEGEFIWEVDCFGEKVFIKELNGAKYEAASAFADKTKWDVMQVLLQRSVVGLGIEDLENMRGKKYLRLKTALTFVYGMNDF